MHRRRSSEAGFVSVALIELCLILLLLGLVALVIFGSNPARIGAGTLLGLLTAAAFILDRHSRLRAGQQVEILSGPQRGNIGTILEPLPQNRGAKVQLDLNG